jgi:hypothetical protein
LESEIFLEILGNLLDEALEGRHLDEEIDAFSDSTKSHEERRFCLTTAVERADLQVALVARFLRGTFPPVDLRVVCLVRAMAWLEGCQYVVWVWGVLYSCSNLF